LSSAAGREGRAVPSVPRELKLALGYGRSQTLDRGHGDIGVVVAQITLLLRQSRNAVADDGAAGQPGLHGVAH